ncbi:MAG: preprotein translocase subunit SecE [Bacillota bacterium]
MALTGKQDKDQNSKKLAVKGGTGISKKDPEKKVVPKNVKKAALAKKDTVNRVEQIKKYFRGVYSELKKVHWPTRREVLIYTSVVVVAVVIVGALIWVFDLLMSLGIRAIMP